LTRPALAEISKRTPVASLLREISEEVRSVWQFHALNGTLECAQHLQQGLAAVAQAEAQTHVSELRDWVQRGLKSRVVEQRCLALLALPTVGERAMLSEPLRSLLIERLSDRSPEVSELARKLYSRVAQWDPRPGQAISALFGALERADPVWRLALDAILSMLHNPTVNRANLELRLRRLADSNSRIRNALTLSRTHVSVKAAPPMVRKGSIEKPGARIDMPADVALLTYPDLGRRQGAARRLALASRFGYRFFQRGREVTVRHVEELVSSGMRLIEHKSKN